MSPAFVALVKKERLSLLVFFVLSVSAGWITITVEGFEWMFVLGSYDRFEELTLVQSGLALLAGIWLGLREEVTRTQEFLRQRPLAPGVSVLARGLAGASLAFLAPLVAGALAIGQDLLLGGGGVGVRAECWTILVAVAASVFATFSASFAAASFPGSPLARMVLLFFTLAAQLALQSWASSVCSGLPWALLVLAYGALLLGAARAAAERALDLDRPVGLRVLGLPLAFMAFVSMAFGSLAVAGWEKLASQALFESRPWIGWTSDGRLVRCSWVGKPGSLAVVDVAGKPTGEELDDDQPRLPPVRYTLHGIELLPLPAARSLWLRNEGVVERRIVLEAEGARWVASDSSSGTRQVVPLLSAGELGDPRLVKHFETGMEDEHTFLFAPGAELLKFSYDGPPRLERVELPGGARPLDTTRFFGSTQEWKLGGALDTTDGAWMYRDGAWVRPAPELYHQPRLGSEILVHDPLRPLQRVSGPNGVVLDIPHPLDSARRKLLAGWMGLSAVLRPLPLALLSAGFDYERTAKERPDEFLLLLDPMLGGGYAWLLGPNVLLHVGLAWAVSREFARRGLDPTRRRRWVLAYLVAGMWIAAWCAALETRRAWRKSRSGPAPAALVSAARRATA